MVYPHWSSGLSLPFGICIFWVSFVHCKFCKFCFILEIETSLTQVMVLSSKFSCFFLLFSLFNPQLKDLFILMLITVTRFWSFFILECNVFWFDSYLLICFGNFLEFVTSAKFFFHYCYHSSAQVWLSAWGLEMQYKSLWWLGAY